VEQVETVSPERLAPLLVAMRGMPGIGKSVVARAISLEFGWPVLDKDRPLQKSVRFRQTEVSAGLERGMDPVSLSIATSFGYGVPLDTQVPLIAEAGFTHLSLGANESHSNYLTTDGQRHLKTLAGQHGLAIDTIHGPRADRPDATAALERAVTAAAELSVPVLVVHGGPFDFPEAELTDRLDQLVHICEGLVPVLAKSYVRLALENVLPGPATELIRRALDMLDPQRFGFCYDSSHDQIGGPHAMHLLAQLRHRLIAVQLSDRIRDFVDHVIPGEGFIHWPQVCAELALARYERPLLLEVSTKHSAVKEPREVLRVAHRQGLQLAAQVNGLDEARQLHRVSGSASV
jgi:sugar phosphate isomerase/epimerase